MTLSPSLYHAPIFGIGISYPGLLDPQGRLTAVNLGWKNFPLVQVFEQAFSWPVFLDHDKHTCGLALSHAISLLNPEVVILGGDLIGGSDVMVPIIQEEITRRTPALSAAGVSVELSTLSLDIRLRGAASLAFRRVLEDSALLKSLCSQF